MTGPISPALQELHSRELATGERVLWTASPSRLDRVLASLIAGLVGLLFTLFACGVIVAMHRDLSVRPEQGPPFAYLIGAFYVLFGGRWLLVPLVEWWLAGRTLYAVTDRRAITIERQAWEIVVRSFVGDALTGAIRRDHPSGRGDLIFEREAENAPKGRTVYRDVGFFGIEDPRGVAWLLPGAESSDAHSDSACLAQPHK